MKNLFITLFIGIIFIAGCNNSLDGSKSNGVEINDNEQNENLNENLDDAKRFDTTISGIITPEDYQISEESFQIDPGKGDLHIIATWAPPGARVVFGFINAQTEEEFWEKPKESGSWQGTIETSHLEADEYYIAIKTEPETSDYDKRERTIVAHFTWK